MGNTLTAAIIIAEKLAHYPPANLLGIIPPVSWPQLHLLLQRLGTHSYMP